VKKVFFSAFHRRGQGRCITIGLDFILIPALGGEAAGNIMQKHGVF